MGVYITFTLNTGDKIEAFVVDEQYFPKIENSDLNESKYDLICELFAFELKKHHNEGGLEGTEEFSCIIAGYIFRNMLKIGQVRKLERGEHVFWASLSF